MSNWSKKTDWPKNCHDLRPNEGNVILEDSLRVLYARNAENIHFRNFSYEITEEMKAKWKLLFYCKIVKTWNIDPQI